MYEERGWGGVCVEEAGGFLGIFWVAKRIFALAFLAERQH